MIYNTPTLMRYHDDYIPIQHWFSLNKDSTSPKIAGQERDKSWIKAIDNWHSNYYISSLSTMRSGGFEPTTPRLGISLRR